jgi:hypothetical protein
MKAPHYVIATSNSTQGLEAEVNKYLKWGYILHSGLVYAVDRSYSQPMVKYFPAEEPLVPLNKEPNGIMGDWEEEVKPIQTVNANFGMGFAGYIWDPNTGITEVKGVSKSPIPTKEEEEFRRVIQTGYTKQEFEDLCLSKPSVSAPEPKSNTPIIPGNEDEDGSGYILNGCRG